MDGPGSGNRTGRVIDHILAHYGTKGMKWGVRRKNSPGMSEDVAKVEASKNKIKIGGTKSLSNAELQSLVTRANLEQQWSRLNPSASKKATQFVADILLNAGKQQATSIVSNLLAKQVANAMKKS